jgi:uncharacterized membrane protein YfcA
MFEIIPLVVILAFLFETMDSCAGMGFGTGLTPLLFVLGYEPLQVVPILLISEAITGFTAGFFHNEFGNANFRLKKPINRETKVMLNIAIFGCLAIILSVFLTYYAIQVDKSLIKTYVAILVIVMGIIAMVKLKTNTSNYKPKLLTFFSGLAGFNKGIGAGGYGPVVMLGQIFSGIYEKTATAITSLSEGIVSLVGVGAFVFIPVIKNLPIEIDFLLVPSVFTGGFIAALISPYMVRIFPNKIWKIIIPIYALAIGIYVLAQLFIL